MANFALLIGCLLAGWMIRRLGRLPVSTPAVLNGYVIHLSLPALILVQFHGLRLDSTAWAPGLMPWFYFLAAGGFFFGVGRALGWDRRLTGALILTGGLGNTSFVGFPLLVSLLGEEALKPALLVDQPGSFLVVSTLGILVAGSFGAGARDLRSVVLRLVKFPPLQALVLAWFLRDVTWPEWVGTTLSRLAGTLIPLSLFSVGFQLDVDPSRLRRHWRPLSIGLGWKLLLSPALVLLACLALGLREALDPLVFKVIVLESAMASMITSAVVAEEYGLDAEISNLMLSVGIPLSLVTVPLWNRLLS